MKNRIITIIILLLVVLLAISMIWGIEFKNIKILSISQLIEKDKNITTKIQEASVLASVDFPESIQNLEETYEKLTIQKRKYEEIASLSDADNKKIYETKRYDIVYLWKIVGKYAKSRNLTIGMDVQKSGQTNLYDLKFSVRGQYVNISQFIADIENNSDLYFRIYNFRMNGSGDIINATFTVKDVNIDSSTLASSAVKNKIN